MLYLKLFLFCISIIKNSFHMSLKLRSVKLYCTRISLPTDTMPELRVSIDDLVDDVVTIFIAGSFDFTLC